MSTKYINNWETWVSLAEYYEFNPYEKVDFGIDTGGGNSIDLEFTGQIPEEEK